ncbi:uncharacterized protein LOC142223662 [Haematobia irritans]|uniref:uncharacterized protein LOC142223662 n=1 Tax=Haematobia irritans TaxID=7368 RepID=UPI003F4FC2EA
MKYTNKHLFAPQNNISQHQLAASKKEKQKMAARLPNANKQPNRPKGWIYSCGLCRKDHPLKTCPKFLSREHADRYEIACGYFYCINCLACSHDRRDCRTTACCQICYQKHNTLLHYAPQIAELRQRPTEQAEPTPSRENRPTSRDTRPTSRDTRHSPRDNHHSSRDERPHQPQPSCRRSVSKDRESRSEERTSRVLERSSNSAKRPLRSLSEFRMVPRVHFPFNGLFQRLRFTLLFPMKLTCGIPVVQY